MLDQKSEVSKKFKKSNFPKGLVHGFCPKIELFTMRFFRHPKAEKSVFLIFWIEKNTFPLRKGKFQKCPQNWIFHRGQSLFLSKNRAFYDVVFQAPQSKKECFLIFWIENNTFQIIKGKFLKMSEKIGFFKGVSPCFCQKTELSTMWYFQGNQGREDWFLIFWIEKKYFLAQKSKVSIMCKKNRNFLKELVHGSFYHVCDRFLIFRIEKNKFKARKVKFQKMCEKLYFSKGLVHVFCEKNGVFYYAGFLGKLRQKRSVFF